MDIAHTYRFAAFFEDGTVIEQNDTDTSTKEKGKNSYFDVLEKEKESKLVSFVIHNGETQVGVDLQDGHFEINGVPFFQHRSDLTPYKDFRTIYFRTVQRQIHQQTGVEISASCVGYTVGWQVTYKGENVQRTITI